MAAALWGTRFLVGAWWGGADRPVPGAWPGLVCPHAPGRPSCQPHPRPDSCEAGSEACGPGGAVTPCNPPRAVAAAAVTGNAGPPHPVPVGRAPVLLWHRPHGGWGSSACWRRALTSRGGVQGSLCVGVRLGSVQSQAGCPGEKPCSVGSPPTALLTSACRGWRSQGLLEQDAFWVRRKVRGLPLLVPVLAAVLCMNYTLCLSPQPSRAPRSTSQPGPHSGLVSSPGSG